MNKHPKTPSIPGDESNNQDRRITFLSTDGQTEIAVVGERGLKRWPPHEGQVAVVRFRPRPNTRIRCLDDGRTEVVFRHSEILGLLYALNACERDGFLYDLPRAPHKTARQRRHWERINKERILRNRAN